MNAEEPRAAISVQNIVKRYGDFVAVAGITFEVAEGEIFGLLGPNGAGKSTLIRMMTTLTPATEGRAIIAGHDVAREPDSVRRTIGVIQVLNKRTAEEFTFEDEAILSALSTQAAVAIDNSRLFLSLTQKNRQLLETKVQLEHRVKDLIGVTVEVEVVDPFGIERVTVGKAKRVLDRRLKQ